MENATEALYMAAAVLLFVMALTVSIVSFTNAKTAADTILYRKDETTYYEYTEVSGKAEQNRIVGLETIIPTLYKYYRENYTVVFKQANYNKETGEFSNEKYLPVYKSSSSIRNNWQKSYIDLMSKKYGIRETALNTDIFSFDLDEETLRHEPWTGSYERIKNNLDCFLNGKTYFNPNNNRAYINYSSAPLTSGGFIAKYKNAKFVETILEYDYGSAQAKKDEFESSVSDLVNKKTKRMIIFTKIN